MKKMKSLFTKTFLIIICITLSMQFVSANVIKNIDEKYKSGVYTEGYNNNPDEQALMLKKLGLFKGSDVGFELERNMTRSEAAVVMVRLLGHEELVLNGDWSCPFTDLPDWVKPYVGWMYESGLTKGISSTKYGPMQNVTMEQFAIFLTRILEGEDTEGMNGFVASNQEIEISKQIGLFSRGAAVGMIVRSLVQNRYRSGMNETLAQYLIRTDVFTEEAFIEAAWNIVPSHYYKDDLGYIVQTINGVEMNKSEITVDKILDEYYYSNRVDNHSLITYKYGEEGVDLYSINCKSLEATNVGFLALGKDSDGEYNVDFKDIGVINTNRYVIAYDWDDEKAESSIQILFWNEEDVILSEISLGTTDSKMITSDTAYYITDKNLIVTAKDRCFIATPEGDKYISYEPNTKIFDFFDDVIITELQLEKSTIISALNTFTGDIIDSYEVALITSENPEQGSLNKMLYIKQSHEYFYGSAGLYRFIDNRLIQVTDLPVADIDMDKSNSLYLLVCKAEDPIHVFPDNGSGLGGNRILRYDLAGMITTVLDDNPDHGLAFSRLQFDDLDVLIGVKVTGYNMGHSSEMHYAISNDGEHISINPIEYFPNPVEMTSDEEIQEAIEKERGRLDELGY